MYILSKRFHFRTGVVSSVFISPWGGPSSLVKGECGLIMTWISLFLQEHTDPNDLLSEHQHDLPSRASLTFLGMSSITAWSFGADKQAPNKSAILSEQTQVSFPYIKPLLPDLLDS